MNCSIVLGDSMKNIIKDFLDGNSINAYQYFGAHKIIKNNTEYYRFACYAPHAKRIELVGDFNGWNGDNHPFEKVSDAGIWEITTKDAAKFSVYKFKITGANNEVVLKADPYAFFSELRPLNASVVYDINEYTWGDSEWISKRTKNIDKPLNIYECHLGSWRRNPDGSMYDMEQFIEELIPYVKDNGFTHIELMPLNEHPFDGSWGYQATGYYASTARYGKPSDIKKFIDECHKNDIGVILDVVPAHFVKDDHGLATFDGAPLYEYKNEYDSENPWGTLNFNLWDNTVRSFLISSFAYWLEEFHFDGLRFDAVAHVIHWGGDKTRGENQGAIEFFKRCNYLLSTHFKEVMLIAEDSSDFYGVTKSIEDGGLGFDYKWDLGWMNDTLRYFALDPLFRGDNHHLINFSMFYFYNEKFLLPFSHDEVVHMKGSIINKIWGNYEQKFEQLKLLIAYMYAHPGKKLNFMGNEIGTFDEWNENKAIAFNILGYDSHMSVFTFFKDINAIYRSKDVFYKGEYDSTHFKWLDVDNKSESIFSFYRILKGRVIVCLFNMTPIEHKEYRLGVPKKGYYKEIINSQNEIYDGCGFVNEKIVCSEGIASHGQTDSISIKIAPFAALYFEYRNEK